MHIKCRFKYHFFYLDSILPIRGYHVALEIILQEQNYDIKSKIGKL